jgi:UDP-N-acetylmuramate dehydrogenase
VSEALDALLAQLQRDLPIAPEEGVPFAMLSTYRVGGPVSILARVPSMPALVAVARAVRTHRPRVLTVGRGSNLLMTDAGFSGLVVKLEGEFDSLLLPRPGDGPAAVRAGGAVALPVLARKTATAGWRDLEFYVGIPGSVGGAIRMNAGGHGQETAEVLRRAWVVDLLGDRTEPVARPTDALGLGYRQSALGATEVVTEAEFGVTADVPADCERRVAEVVQWRRENQPGGANAGSVFRNPPGDTAGRLIEDAGLKGFRIGGAVVSTKHANFVQGEAGATARDVQALIAEVQRRVADAAGVHLEPELHVVGDDA